LGPAREANLADDGVNVGHDVLSERLGHASTSITSDIYVHALARQHTDAAERIGGVLSGTKECTR
jgi:integrase